MLQAAYPWIYTQPDDTSMYEDCIWRTANKRLRAHALTGIEGLERFVNIIFWSPFLWS